MNKKKRLTVIDLFSGAGGFSIGFINARDKNGKQIFDVRLLADIDKEAAYTFKRNYPEISFLVEDLKSVKPRAIQNIVKEEEIDIVIGGPPCQGFSSAGKRLFDDERNQLLRNFVEIVVVVKPKMAIMENVPTLLGSQHQEYADELIEWLDKKGYDTQATILKSEDYGVPQLRRRAFFAAFRKDLKLKMKSCFPKISDNSDDNETPNVVSVEDAIGDLPSLKAGTGEDPVVYSTPAQSLYQKERRTGSEFLFNHVARKHADWFLKKISIIKEGSSNKDLEPHQKFSDNYFSQAYARLHRKQPSYTITTSFLNPGSGRFIHYRDKRSITVREAARLQSFDDSFVFYGTLATQERHVGNAVPPLMSIAWAKHIASLLGRD